MAYKRVKNSVFFLLFFITLSVSAAALPPVETYDVSEKVEYYDTTVYPYDELYNLIDSINIGQQRKSFNGSILVGYKGKVIYSNSYGYADKTTGEENSMEISTQLASISKTFTGTAAMWLQEKGLLDINKSVQTYIPEFPFEDITVEMLLSHRSGLPDYLNFSGKYWNSSEPMYNEDVLKMFTENSFFLRFVPGSRFQYCNSNFALLGLIIERVTEMDYKDFMNTYLFEPLHLNKTFVLDPNEEMPYPTAKSYNARFSEWNLNYQDGVYADKGIFSTVEDLYKWDNALKSDKFLSEEAQEEAYTPRSPWSVQKNYGLGWRLKCYPNGEKVVYHTGWWHGYQGIFSRYIKDDFTVIILSNRYIHGISANAQKIYKECTPYLNLSELK